jgi:uncharacterized protein YdaL
MRKIKTPTLHSLAQNALARNAITLCLLTAALAACGTAPTINGNLSNGDVSNADAPTDVGTAATTPVVTPLTPTNEVVILYSNVSNSPYPYTDLSKTYATFIGNLVGRYPELKITSKAISDYKAGDAQKSKRTFYIGSYYDEAVPAALQTDIAGGAPVTWMNYNLWRLDATTMTKLGLKFLALHPAYTPDEYNTTFNKVEYKGYTYNKYLAPMEMNEVQVTAVTNPPTPGSSTAPVVQAYAVNSSGAKIPYVTQSGNFYFVADNPFTYMHETDRYVAFTDMIGPMLGHNETCEARAVARVEDLSPTNDVTAVSAMMGTLKKLNAPFGVTVIPEYVDNTTTPVTRVSWKNKAQMLKQLKNIPAMGGVYFQHGYTHQFDNMKNPYGISGDDWEFWDRNTQAPIVGMTPTSALLRITTGKKILNDLGITNIVGWTTPHYAADPGLYKAFDTVYNRVWERRLYQSGTVIAGQFYTYPVRDAYGSLVIPENLGNIQENNLPAKIIENARANRNLRCPWAGVFFHPYLLETGYDGIDKTTPAQLEKMISDIQAMGYKFVNPATVTQ